MGQQINASSRPVGQRESEREREIERERAGYFMVVLLLLQYNSTGWPGSPRLKSQECLGMKSYAAKEVFWKVVKTQSFRPQWNLVHVIRPHAQVFKKKLNFLHCPWIFFKTGSNLFARDFGRCFTNGTLNFSFCINFLKIQTKLVEHGASIIWHVTMHPCAKF